MRALLCLILLIVTGSAPGLAEEEHINQIVNIYFADENHARQDVLPLHLGIEDVGPGWLRACVNTGQLLALRDMGYRIEVLYADARARAAERRAQMEHDFRWTSYAAAATTLAQIAAAHPDICRLHNIGNTVQNRSIWVMEITDNPDIDEPDEPEVRIVGNIHGDEYVSFEMMLLLVELLTDNYGSDPAITALVNEREIWIQPSLNPDGHELGRRGNANNVDMNRNLGYMWNYSGSQAFSEIEMRHFRTYSLARNFTLSLSFHGEARYINYLWNFTPNPSPDEPLLIELSNGYQALGNNYTVISGWDWYQTNGDVNDWSYGCRGGLDWTIETPGYSEGSVADDWADNRDAILYMIDRAGQGLWGTVTDAISGEPLEAIVTVLQNPWPVYTDPAAGDYHRYLAGGVYGATFWANGYEPLTLTGAVVPVDGRGALNAALTPNGAVHALHVCTYTIHYYFLNHYNNMAYPHFALGPPDGQPCSIAPYCALVVDTGSDYHIANRSGDDLLVTEADVGDGSEGFSIYGSSGGFQGPWVLIGTGAGTTAFDLGPAGLSAVRYFKITDDNDGVQSGPNPGFDLDALSSFSQSTPTPLATATPAPLPLTGATGLALLLTLMGVFLARAARRRTPG